MMDISACCALLPGAWFSVPAPTFLQCLAAYSLLLLPFLLPRLKPPTRRRLGALFLATLLLAAWPLWHSRHNWTLTLLPLDGGEAVWIDAPGKRNDLLIDCGNARAAERITLPYLRSQGVNHVPRLALTHGDIRNYGGATNVIEDFRIREVLLSRARFRSTGYRRLEEHLTQTNLTLTRLNPGDHSGVWKTLHPPPESSFSRADDSALVLKGEIHGMRILLLSDLGRAGQETLLASGVDLKAHIVVAGLPEQDEPLRSNLLDAIQPELVVITDSEYPATQRAPRRLRERFERTGTPVIHLRNTGAIRLRIRPDGWTFQPPPKAHIPD
jgi:competence protein ComEC